MTRLPTFALMLSCLPFQAHAQNPCEGSGVGEAYMTTTHAMLGDSLLVDIGSPAAANSIGLLLFGNGAGQNLPFCFDTSQFFLSLIAVLDTNGNAQFDLPMPVGAFDATLYGKPLIWEPTPGRWSLGKSARMQTEFPGSYRELDALAGARSLHTCTSLSSGPADNVTGAFVAGGATGNLIAPTALATTETFDTITRTWTAGPTMSVARTSHAAVLFDDNTVLVTGGMTNAASGTGGPATASVELFLPDSGQMVSLPSMLEARMGHAMTRLDDGRILVSGGFADWTDAGQNFVPRLNTARDTTEIYDPATGTWTVGPVMASRRSGHTQTLLRDGRVLIAGGCSGGTTIPQLGVIIEAPIFTSSCEIFDPTTGALLATAPCTQPRGFQGAGLLPDDTVLMTGGAANVGFYGEGAASGVCDRWDPATGQWTTAAQLPTPVAFHTQIIDQVSGDAVITGGFVGNFTNLQGSVVAYRHDGTAVTALETIAGHPALAQPAFEIGSHAAAQLHDGSILIAGGFAWGGLGGAPSGRSMLYFVP